MTDSAQLDPLAPLSAQESMEQRIARKLAGYKARLTQLERSRPIPSIGAFAPTGTPVPGTRHIDTNARRLYVYGDQGWSSADADRAVAFDASQVSTAVTGSWVDLGGPTLSIYVPAPAVVGIQVDVSLWASQSGTNLTEAYCGLRQPDGTTTLVAVERSVFNTWRRRLSTPGRDSTTAGGALYPVGGMMVMPLAAAGTYTWSLRYAANVQVGTAQTVFFSSRRLWAVIL